VQQSFDRVYSGFKWTELPGNPGPQNIFGPAVYQRGAMTVHALRRTIGDEAFGKLLTTWTAEQRDGTATTDEFIATAEKVSGKDLTSLFDAWLFGTDPPPIL
jgi:aminopeptidase N